MALQIIIQRQGRLCFVLPNTTTSKDVKLPEHHQPPLSFRKGSLIRNSPKAQSTANQSITLNAKRYDPHHINTRLGFFYSLLPKTKLSATLDGSLIPFHCLCCISSSSYTYAAVAIVLHVGLRILSAKTTCINTAARTPQGSFSRTGSTMASRLTDIELVNVVIYSTNSALPSDFQISGQTST